MISSWTRHRHPFNSSYPYEIRTPTLSKSEDKHWWSSDHRQSRLAPHNFSVLEFCDVIKSGVVIEVVCGGKRFFFLFDAMMATENESSPHTRRVHTRSHPQA